jgi:hypothetical protein
MVDIATEAGILPAFSVFGAFGADSTEWFLDVAFP